MESPYAPSGNMHQSSVVDSINEEKFNRLPSAVWLGIIQDVYTVDNTNITNLNPSGAYTLYSVELSPLGIILQNVPAAMLGGHLNTQISSMTGRTPINNQLSGIPTPPNDVQNIEETPYVIGQPVLIVFIGNSKFNPIIVGALPVPAPTNGATIGQTTANYPRKYGSFQGASWFIDKTGNGEIDFPASSSLTIRIGGQIFCIIRNGEVDLGGDNAGTQPTILGDVLNTYLSNFASSFTSHVHNIILPTPGSPTTPPLVPQPAPSGIETTVVRVK